MAPASAQVQAVNSGFAAVGLNGTFQPPVNNCGGVPSVPDLTPVGLIALVLLLGLGVLLRLRGLRARGA